MPRIILETETFQEMEQSLRDKLEEVQEINQMIAAGESARRGAASSARTAGMSGFLTRPV